ncbi:mucin TcMUCII, putative [Trypanosoma cruzi marinkellei]|uniref:Mucin TcMUCII, putative n=1 Tax=Trypanosoma cruzi marinkellei TaxID=85056 RepID=K2MVL7_TRYCR|nr:mucin TcMUCII, putative [Trypanosoma cruzi marinkellei]
MMMTCRLLCALLALAVCCCPAVCAAGTNLDQNSGSNGKIVTPPSHAPAKNPAHGVSGDSGKNAPPKDPVHSSPSRLSHEAVSQVTAPSGPLPNVLGEEPGTDGGAGISLTASGKPSDDATDMLKVEDSGAKGGTPSDTSLPAEQTVNKAHAQSEKTTTTTTTKAPTTTTTTAPEAPSTTTTEAPTTTTTRAPSRSREIDGSLSSSAWVCAPLLLAASALTYTALG